MTKKKLFAGELIDKIMGETTRFCLHNHIFFHKNKEISRSQPESSEIVFGGERVTHLYPNDCYQAHLSVYYFAAKYCKNHIVLDAGSGAGYGSAYLADHGAKHVIGIDISQEAIDFSKYYFKRDNLDFLQGDIQQLSKDRPFSFDVIFCSNVLEHVLNVNMFLDAFTRLLKPEGVVIIAVPPITSKELREQDLMNPYHVNIWSPRQWYNVLKMYFSDVQMFVHLFDKPGTALNFANTPSETVISETDFKFEQISSIDPFYITPTLSATFILRDPLDEKDIPDAESQITFVDESFTLTYQDRCSNQPDSIDSTTQTNLGPLKRGIKICQKFTSTQDNICAISMLVATYCKQIQSIAKLSIHDAENNIILRQVEVDTTSFADNSWQRFNFDPIINSRGKKLLFCIRTDGRDEAITFWTNNNISGICQKNGVDLSEAVCFRSHYAEG